jgi:hypothetical protein
MFQMGDEHAALNELAEASQCKQLPEHDQINQAIEYRGDGSKVFQVPLHLIFKPSSSKIQNVGKVDYLGKSKVVAVLDEKDNYTEFKWGQDAKRVCAFILRCVKVLIRSLSCAT